MRILGIDPGSRTTGWGVVEVEGEVRKVVACGSIVLDGRKALSLRLASLCSELTGLVAEWGPATAAVEAPFHGVNARSALQLAHARGAILSVLGEARIEVHEYAPATVKKVVSGHGRADKAGIQAMVAHWLPEVREPVLRSADLADALAIALCHAWHRSPELLATTERNR